MYYTNIKDFAQLSNVKDNSHGDSVIFITIVSFIAVFIITILFFVYE